MIRSIFLVLILSLSLAFRGQGSFAPDADSPGTTAIHKDSSAFISWASGCISYRGPQDIAVSGSPLVSLGDDYMATGKSGVNGTISLGDGGEAILTFDQPIINGTGWDFAVFENSFNNTFLELAFVEVSSDGVNFFRFDATSETQYLTQTDGFGSTNPTEINNLAGKYRAQFGTPFDLEELAGQAGLDIQNITHVKIIDVVGSIDENFASYDHLGNKINDPYPTDFPSGGFDLDAVGVIHEKPLSIEQTSDSWSIYPNPSYGQTQIKAAGKHELMVYNSTGTLLMSFVFTDLFELNLSDLPSGVYHLKIDQTLKKLVVL